MAPPRPMRSRTTASASRVVPVCTVSVTSRRSSARARTLVGHLGVVEPVGDGAQTVDVDPAAQPLGEPLREAS